MAGELLLEAFPLTWPDRQPRTPASRRRGHSAFKVPMAIARDELVASLRLLGAKDVVVSSNVPVRRDGLPYADAREPNDPGVAVYFERQVNGARVPFVIACDTYNRVRANVRAIGLTVDALRSIQRHGASSMLEQAFTGFAALPAHVADPPWWVTLGVPEHASADEVREAYRELARRHHPDVGGDAELMGQINRAHEAARAAQQSGDRAS